MNKKFNLFALGVVAGLGIGFAPMVVKVLTLFSVVAILWNEWDDYEVRRENDDLYKYSENVGTNARSKEY
ncbi:hypothetical protein [Enterococcus asini]|uniref:hypothetical protein n=1 Tax=Enterococcus asini TaxID=57732 RepID=UPI00288FF452|nr:hypothetical protein [Enterococcus asini]MDT2744654.1 hypothetical protein [Enterococcus asini]